MEPTDDKDARKLSPEDAESVGEQLLAEEIRRVVTGYSDVFSRVATIGAPLALAVQGLHDQLKPHADDWVSRVIGLEVKHDELIAYFSNMAQKYEAALVPLREELENLQRAIAEAVPHIRKALEGAGRLGAAGWTISMDMTFPEVLLIESLESSQLAAHFVDHYEDDPELNELEGRLCEISEFQEFRPLMVQCFSAYRRGHFAITISPLLSLFERAIRNFRPSDYLHRARVERFVKERYQSVKQDDPEAMEAYIWMSLEGFCRWLYQQYAPAEANVTRTFRHGIQHGTQAPSNERVEALRLFHALNTVIALYKTEKGIETTQEDPTRLSIQEID